MLNWEESKDYAGRPRFTAVDEAGYTYVVSTHYMGEGYEGQVTGPKSKNGFRPYRKCSAERKTRTHMTVKGRHHSWAGEPYKTVKGAMKWCEKEAENMARMRAIWARDRARREEREAQEGK